MFWVEEFANYSEIASAKQKALLEQHNIDFIVLARYMQVLSDDFVKDYPQRIINIHHSYVEQSLPIISQYAEKVATVHGHHHEEVIEINRLFQEAAGDLAAHLKKEELVLFPFIKQLYKADKDGTDANTAHFGTVNNPINMMENEHESVGDIFKTIAKLSNNYTPPEEACNTFRALYASLDEFEQDLHQHIHLENNILHPKAIALEKKLLG